MHEKEALEDFLRMKQEEFKEVAETGNIEELYDINNDIQDTLTALYS